MRGKKPLAEAQIACRQAGRLLALREQLARSSSDAALQARRQASFFASLGFAGRQAEIQADGHSAKVSLANARTRLLGERQIRQVSPLAFYFARSPTSIPKAVSFRSQASERANE